MPTSSNTRAFLKRFILASAAVAAAFAQTEPPRDLAKRVAQRATETRLARNQYMYRQTVIVEDVSPRGATEGQYKEVREVIFTADGKRVEQFVSEPRSNLKRLKLTEEDFRDVREIQPFLFDAEQLWAYETRFKGEEDVDGVDCWVLMVRPRQILEGQRLFDGMIWVDKRDLSIVRTVGKAVPDLRKFRGEENLFPRFTTLWEPAEGGAFRFPVYTYADDTLDFRVGPQRIRLRIRYSDYRKFGVESTIKFGEER